MAEYPSWRQTSLVFGAEEGPAKHADRTQDDGDLEGRHGVTRHRGGFLIPERWMAQVSVRLKAVTGNDGHAVISKLTASYWQFCFVFQVWRAGFHQFSRLIPASCQPAAVGCFREKSWVIIIEFQKPPCSISLLLNPFWWLVKYGPKGLFL